VSEDKKQQTLEPLESASPEVKEIIKLVLRLEGDKLHQQKPHINSDIIKIIKEVIQ